MEQAQDYLGEDVHEVTSLAIRLYSKDNSTTLEEYEDMKAKMGLLSSTGSGSVPQDYLDRAAAALKANRDMLISKRKRIRGVFLIVAGLLLLTFAFAVFFIKTHPPAAAH